MSLRVAQAPAADASPTPTDEANGIHTPADDAAPPTTATSHVDPAAAPPARSLSPIGFSIEDAKILSDTWELARSKGLDQLGYRHYKCLVELGGDEVREMFKYTHLDRQQKMLVSVVRWVTTMQDRQAEIEGLTRLANYHSFLGVTDHLLEIFGQALTQALAETLGDAYTNKMREAWSARYARVTAMFKEHRLPADTTFESKAQKKAYVELLSYFQTSREDLSLLAMPEKEGNVYVSHYGSDALPSDTVPHTNTAFRRRWVILRGRYLYIQRKEGAAPTNVLDLAYSSLVDTSKIGDLPTPSPFSFALVDSVNYPTYFLCAGDDDKEHWYEALLRQLGRFSFLKETFPKAKGGQLKLAIIGEQLDPRPVGEEDFEMLTLVGRGSFGHVYKVMEKSSGKIYAVKVIKKSSLRAESRIENLKCEKTILRNISHPFIVKLHSAFQGKDSLYLLFTFLSGGELFFHMQKSNAHFSEAKSRFYIAETALAVSYLHSERIIHRDLKAENLVLDSVGHVTLTDFGFAKVLEPDEGLPHHTCGTLAYMAPEIFVKSTIGYGAEVDWWSMGVLLFNMLTGRYPFLCKTPQETLSAITTQPLVYPDQPILSENAVNLVNKLLKKKPTNRLSSIEDLKKHPWFDGFDWVKCYNKELTPPFIPDCTGRNTKYFQPCERGASLASLSSMHADKSFSSFIDVQDTYLPAEDIHAASKES